MEHKEAKNRQSEQQERKRIKNNEDNISSLWDNFKCPNIRIIRVPEGEEKEQEMGNLFEKIMKENFPNFVKEVDMQPRKRREFKKDGSKKAHSKTHHN